MKHFFLPAVVLLTLIVSAVPADAGLRWCAKDPIVELNGTQVQILVAVPEGQDVLVTGPVKVTIATPEGVERIVTFTDDGFNNHGEEVIFTDLKNQAIRPVSGDFRTLIRVQVPMDTELLPLREVVPVQVSVIVGDALPVVVVGTADKTQVNVVVPGPGTP